MQSCGKLGHLSYFYSFVAFDMASTRHCLPINQRHLDMKVYHCEKLKRKFLIANFA